MPITTYTFGTGQILRHFITSWGTDMWLCSFPKWGRKYVLAHEVVDIHIFSNN